MDPSKETDDVEGILTVFYLDDAPAEEDEQTSWAYDDGAARDKDPDPESPATPT